MKELSRLFVLSFLISFSNLYAQKVPKVDIPDLFGYNRTENRMFKIDILNAVRDLNRIGFSGYLNVGFEQKLLPALSIEAAVGTWYQFRFAPATASAMFSLPDGSINLTISPRFYHTMNKRLREKWAGNNLSGNYFSIQGTTQLIFFRRDSRILGGKGIYFFQGFTVAPMYGMQRRLGKRGFVDFNFGLRFLNGEHAESGFIIRTPDEMRWRPSPVSTMRIGVAF